MTSSPTPATVLAFDFGTRRIGVAVGNTVTRQATPLTTIDTPDDAARREAIAELVSQWTPSQLVVGVPVHSDGTPHAMTARARAFAATLRKRHGLPVAEADERHTTQEAQSMLDASTVPRSRHRAVRDQVAAQVILQAWFDERAG